MTITVADSITVALRRTPFLYGWIVPQDAASVTIEMLASSSMSAQLAGNVLGINQTLPYPIVQIGTSIRGGQQTQIFRVGTPVSS